MAAAFDLCTEDVRIGMCLLSAEMIASPVTGVNTVEDEGLYTVVTMEPYIVVNGFVVSPFAHSHYWANVYYNFYRALHSVGLPVSPYSQDLMRSFHTIVLGLWDMLPWH